VPDLPAEHMPLRPRRAEPQAEPGPSPGECTAGALRGAFQDFRAQRSAVRSWANPVSTRKASS
jgi:hypothetical protein